MKCPHCEYEDSVWNKNVENYVNGNHGEFYELPVKAERNSPWSYQKQHQEVYGCPCCGKMFMEVY